MLLTPKEVATQFRVTQATVRRWTREGLVPAVKVGKTIRFREEDIDALIKGSEPPAKSPAKAPGRVRTA